MWGSGDCQEEEQWKKRGRRKNGDGFNLKPKEKALGEKGNRGLQDLGLAD